MNISPVNHAESLRIGTVDFVSPDEIKVLLNIETPEAVTLNSGVPHPFPRVNSYVLLSSDQGYLVGQVEWITVEQSQYPKRKGMQDFGLVDLPYPLRKMSVNPLGTLTSPKEGRYIFRRGIGVFPTVGDPVLLPTQIQLRAIVESGENRYVRIGVSPLAGNAEVKIDPDRMFGRHLAVLGNTGSGKSCTVAGLVRWSLEAARRKVGGDEPNARFIVLDPNGEYSKAFEDVTKVRLFSVEPSRGSPQLQIPIWFWNTSEWSAFTKASARTQRPTLVKALRSVRDGLVDTVVTPSHEMRRFLRTLVSIIQIERNAGRPWASFPHPKNFFEKICRWQEGLTEDASFVPEETAALAALSNKITAFKEARSGDWPTYDFTRLEIDEFLALARAAHTAFGGSDADTMPIDADVPRPFAIQDFLRSIEATAELLNVPEYVETMLMRIRMLLSDVRMRAVSGDTQDVSLHDWLTNYVGDNQASNGSITIIDLSLLSAEMVHIITSVIARMTLEALQRYRKLHDGDTLPTVLVMEEAHTFVKRYRDSPEVEDSAVICTQVFEKIAREGRKFGLGLVLSSQRPSELSPTVLSQCNTFLLHRISNDLDQDLVRRLVPDNFRGLLRDLPSLPAREAVLLGWASELPLQVTIDYLAEKQRPESDDPDFWAVWTGEERKVDWQVIAEDWQQTSPPDDVDINE